MSDFKYIFEPLKIGSMTVKNRIEFAPVGPLMASNGLVSRELIEWGREFARGGAGIVTLGMSGIVIIPGIAPGNALNLGLIMPLTLSIGLPKQFRDMEPGLPFN